MCFIIIEILKTSSQKIKKKKIKSDEQLYGSSLKVMLYNENKDFMVDNLTDKKSKDNF